MDAYTSKARLQAVDVLYPLQIYQKGYKRGISKLGLSKTDRQRRATWNRSGFVSLPLPCYKLFLIKMMEINFALLKLSFDSSQVINKKINPDYGKRRR